MQAVHEELALLAAAASGTRAALLENAWFFLGLVARSMQLAQLTASCSSVPGARSDDDPPPSDASDAGYQPQYQSALFSPQFLADLSALVSLVCREFVDAFANIVLYTLHYLMPIRVLFVLYLIDIQYEYVQ